MNSQTVESLSSETLTLVTNDNQVITLPVNSNVSAKVSTGDPLQLGIRPEHLEIHQECDVKLNFKSEVVERLGNSTYMFGQSSGIDGFTVHLPGDQEVQRDQAIQLSCKSSDCHLFTTDGICITS